MEGEGKWTNLRKGIFGTNTNENLTMERKCRAKLYLKDTLEMNKWQTRNESSLQCGWIFYVPYFDTSYTPAFATTLCATQHNAYNAIYKLLLLVLSSSSSVCGCLRCCFTKLIVIVSRAEQCDSIHVRYGRLCAAEFRCWYCRCCSSNYLPLPLLLFRNHSWCVWNFIKSWDMHAMKSFSYPMQTLSLSLSLCLIHISCLYGMKRLTLNRTQN